MLRHDTLLAFISHAFKRGWVMSLSLVPSTVKYVCFVIFVAVA